MALSFVPIAVIVLSFQLLVNNFSAPWRGLCNVLPARDSIGAGGEIMKPKLSEIYWPLRLAYGLVPLLAGRSYLPLNDGVLFSKNAFVPSRKSSVAATKPKQSAPSSADSSNVRFKP
jgi:hypothetical protein